MVRLLRQRGQALKAGDVILSVAHQPVPDPPALFALLAGEQETRMPEEIRVSSGRPSAGARVTMLGAAAELSWRPDGEGFVVAVPENLRARAPSGYAWTIKVSRMQ